MAWNSVQTRALSWDFNTIPSGTELAEQFGHGWRYAVMPNRNSDELFHFQENQIQLLTPEELVSELIAEIEFYQQQIAILQQQGQQL